MVLCCVVGIFFIQYVILSKLCQGKISSVFQMRDLICDVVGKNSLPFNMPNDQYPLKQMITQCNLLFQPLSIESCTGIKFPDIKSSGVSLRSQRMKLPASVGQKKVKAIEQLLGELNLGKWSELTGDS